MARVAALFRRLDAMQKPQAEDGSITRGSLEIDTDRMTVQWRGSPVGLTLTEFWLVHAMARYPGHVKNRQQLMDAAQAVLDDNTITCDTPAGMPDTDVLYETDRGRARITLNRPDKLNAISWELAEELAALFKSLQDAHPDEALSRFIWHCSTTHWSFSPGWEPKLARLSLNVHIIS